MSSAVARRRAQNPVVERPGVVVAEVVQAVGALGEAAQRRADSRRAGQRPEGSERGFEHGLVVELQDRAPGGFEDARRIVRRADAAEPWQHLHFGCVPQAAVHQAGVAQEQRGYCAGRFPGLLLVRR